MRSRIAFCTCAGDVFAREYGVQEFDTERYGYLYQQLRILQAVAEGAENDGNTEAIYIFFQVVAIVKVVVVRG